ncbi:MAG: EamA family transporter [Gammaproteobacteria bacterium]|nr:EamA family transporter [Gammaproteobacteria bacterium]
MLIGILTALTLIAFAANSLLCRMALGGELIDPQSFTTLRLISGAIILVPISRLTPETPAAKEQKGSWASGLALFVYAAAFSLAYITLDTGMGALILFGAVQATMIGVGLKSGERPHLLQWLGLIAALSGLLYLVSPGITAPNPLGAFLMMIAGIAWGIYSLRGKKVAAPVSSTTANFVRTVPLAVIASAIAFSLIHLEKIGIILALVSGSITSGLGYVLWYKALRGLTTTRAAIVQLLVPVLAAFGGVIFLAEQLSVRLAIASALILGGVAMAVLNRSSTADTAATESTSG